MTYKLQSRSKLPRAQVIPANPNQALYVGWTGSYGVFFSVVVQSVLRPDINIFRKRFKFKCLKMRKRYNDLLMNIC